VTRPAYRLENVVVRVEGRPLLDIPSLEIPSSRVTALVGPNGAGKTTLLRLLALLKLPDEGRLWIQGERVPTGERDLSRLRRATTFVGQPPYLFDRSVRENVAWGLRARGLPADERVDRALASLGLAGLARRSARRLSAGEAQRVALARALVLDTPIVLLDEPATGLDREHAQRIDSAIAALRESGKTVVFATHELDRAHRLADSVLTIVAGQLSARPIVNVLRGHFVREAGETFLEAHETRIELPPGAERATAVTIAPEDIVVSTSPIESSARNRLRGRVVRAEHDGRGVLLSVDCGPILVARITAHSYRELRLDVGCDVWLAFKSSAIHVLEDS
jgi:tungstate transport system ATP-binding protein